MKPSEKWLEMAAIYKRFATDFQQADSSDEAAMDAYALETFGTPLPAGKDMNAFIVGKKWMDVMVSMWKEDIAQSCLHKAELVEDGFPQWFLERVGVWQTNPVPQASAWWAKQYPKQTSTAPEVPAEFPALMASLKAKRGVDLWVDIEKAIAVEHL